MRVSKDDTSCTETRKVERKGKRNGDDRQDLPEEKYIGFATNIPKVDLDLYGDRWGWIAYCITCLN